MKIWTHPIAGVLVIAAQGSLPRGPSGYSILPHPLHVCAQPHVASWKCVERFTIYAHTFLRKIQHMQLTIATRQCLTSEARNHLRVFSLPKLARPRGSKILFPSSMLFPAISSIALMAVAVLEQLAATL